MVAGGGHPTKQWFGMYYAGQVGKRIPVPIIQSIEDFAIFGILLLVERWLRSVAPMPGETAEGGTPAPKLLPPAGIVVGVGMVLWGIERFLDEHLWLGEDGHLGSLLVQIAGIALAVVGVLLLISRIGPLQRWRRGEGGDPDPSSALGAEADADSLVTHPVEGSEADGRAHGDELATPAPVGSMPVASPPNDHD